VEPVETYGHFTPGAARSLTGKMGTRPCVVMFARESGKSKYHNSLGRAKKLATSYN
jgi:hypothetical protein